MVEACARLDVGHVLRAAREGQPGIWEHWANSGAPVVFAPFGHVAGPAGPASCDVVATLAMHERRARCRVSWRRSGSMGESYVELAAILSPLTGLRWWWVCPQRGAYAGTIYLPPHGASFASREAHALHYSSTRESPQERAARRARRLREALGEVPAVLGGPVPDRPPRMTAGTYAQAVETIQHAEAQVFRGIGA